MARCHFRKEKLHYLDHVIGKEGMKVHPIEIVTKWDRPIEIENYIISWGFAITFIDSSMIFSFS